MPPRTPTALKVLSGTAAKNPQRHRYEPQPRQRSRAPHWLPKKGVPWSAWCRIKPMLERIRVLTEADQEALALGCIALDDYLRLREQDGDWRKIDAAWKRYWRMLEGFGMTPASRTRVQVVPQDVTDPVQAWADKAK